MKRLNNLRAHPLLGLVLLSIVLMGCPPPVEEDENFVTDIEGNLYKTVTIGNQVWFAENLKTTKYEDGTAIPLVTDNTAWSKVTTPAYCWSNNVIANKYIYGALYNWYTVNTKKLCPTGWHVPSDAEWTTLTTYLGGENVAGGKLKEIGTSPWNSPNVGATNETGFTALPGGFRLYFNGTFREIGTDGEWWSSTESSSINALARGMTFNISGIGSINFSKQYGMSVRCIKD